MTIANEICQDNFIYCKTWTQNLDVKTSKKPKERVKNQCLEIIEKKKKTYDYIIETKIWYCKNWIKKLSCYFLKA